MGGVCGNKDDDGSGDYRNQGSIFGIDKKLKGIDPNEEE